MLNAAVITSISRTQPYCLAANTIRANRGSNGKRESCRPISVSLGFSRFLPGSMALSSSSKFKPSLTKRSSGFCTNGKSRISPRRNADICKITAAKFVRSISGSVYSGRCKKSSSLYKRIQMPGPIRPQRPLR